MRDSAGISLVELLVVMSIMGAALSETAWSVCFSSRGMADANVIVTLLHADSGATRDVEVLRGGMARVEP